MQRIIIFTFLWATLSLSAGHEISFSQKFLQAITTPLNNYQQEFYTLKPHETAQGALMLLLATETLDYFSFAGTGYIIVLRILALQEKLSAIASQSIWRKPISWLQKTNLYAGFSFDIAKIMLGCFAVRTILRIMKWYLAPEHQKKSTLLKNEHFFINPNQQNQ